MTMQRVSVMYWCASNGAACVGKTLCCMLIAKHAFKSNALCIYGLFKDFPLYHWVVLDLTMNRFACRKLPTTWRV